MNYLFAWYMRLFMIVLTFALSRQTQAAEDSIVPSKPTPEVSVSTPIFTDGSLIDQVYMSSEDPKAFDWRNENVEIEVGYDDVQERNVFPAHGWHLGIGFGMQGGWMIRTGIRRIDVYSSHAGDLIEKTPFRQPGQPSRWEIFGLMGYSLVEGRSSSRLSPWLSNLEHVLSFELGGHYVHPSKKMIPTKNGERDRAAGQQVGVSSWVLDTGFRYQLYLPQGFGLFFTETFQFPIAHIDGPLAQWSASSIGLVYAFGGR